MERYVRQCLDSLERQTLREAEFICLTDGSTDSSPAIVREYADRDPRFRVVDKPNSGYGATMNVGLGLARGTYIGILESDDWADPTYFETLYDLAIQSGNCDIARANYYQFDTEGETFIENHDEDLCGRSLSVEGEVAERLIMAVPAIWSAIYSRDMIETNHISFVESPGASYQDTGFVFKCWISARSVVLDHAGYLHYRTGHAGSSSVAKDKVFCVCDEFASIDAFLDEHPEVPVEVRRALAAKRFVTYRWNLNRLGLEDKGAFIKRTSSELVACGVKAGWDRRLLSDAQWKMLQRWMNDPEGLYLDLLIADANKHSKAKAFPLRAFRKVRTLLGKK